VYNIYFISTIVVCHISANILQSTDKEHVDFIGGDIPEYGTDKNVHKTA